MDTRLPALLCASADLSKPPSQPPIPSQIPALRKNTVPTRIDSYDDIAGSHSNPLLDSPPNLADGKAPTSFEAFKPLPKPSTKHDLNVEHPPSIQNDFLPTEGKESISNEARPPAIRGQAPPYSNLSELLTTERHMILDSAVRNDIAADDTVKNSNSVSSSASEEESSNSSYESDSASDISDSVSSNASSAAPVFITPRKTNTSSKSIASSLSTSKNSPPIINLKTLDVIRHKETVSFSPLLRRGLTMEREENGNVEGDTPRRRRHHHHHGSTNNGRHEAVVRERKLKQGRLLLVSLLENFCMLYDQSPERNKKLFFVLCKQLSAMGIIDSEDFLDEVTAVRGAYKRAFKELVIQAMQAIREEGGLRSLTGPSDPQNDDAVKNSAALVLKRPFVLSDDTNHLLSLAHPSPFNESSTSLFDGTPSSAQDFSEILDLNDSSRYHEDFREVHALGKGAFGQVWCVKNKLDGMEYAVKRVKLKENKAGLEKILREVKVHARLSHKNVVRYFSCWLERAVPAKKLVFSNEYAGNGDTVESTVDDYTQMSDKSRDQRPKGWKTRVTITEIESSGSVGARHVEHENESFQGEAEDPFEWDDDSEMEFENEVPAGQATKGKGKQLHPRKELTLFIQMELCGSTLQQYLNRRNKAIFNPQYGAVTEAVLEEAVNNSFCIGIMRDISEGLAYIHKQGCIHRDIAPKNIFWVPYHVSGSASLHGSMDSLSRNPLSTSPLFDTDSFKSTESRFCCLKSLDAPYLRGGFWKIGDFGLVAITEVLDSDTAGMDSQSFLSRINSDKSSQSSWTRDTVASANLDSSISLNSEIKNHTTGIGTITYASPEQLDTSGTLSYTSKSDMYSAGIVLFELLHPIGTGMERARTLMNLRLGVLPDEFLRRFPKEATLILWLMEKNPENRPSAQDCLDLEILNSYVPLASSRINPVKTVEGTDELTQPSSRNPTESFPPRPMAPADTNLSHKRSLIDNITTTLKSWIHNHTHYKDRSRLVSSLESMGVGHDEIKCIISHPEKALELIIESRVRADKAENEAREAKAEVDRLRARIVELELLTKM
ncbi:hypothetical protein BC830DRAFT_1150666 [Chytriomyces sp. MP71]|nr:hypothetical protein BC830DRAFT_1150666 [Chytriomyces sp. MP71]